MVDNAIFSFCIVTLAMAPHRRMPRDPRKENAHLDDGWLLGRPFSAGVRAQNGNRGSHRGPQLLQNPNAQLWQGSASGRRPHTCAHSIFARGPPASEPNRSKLRWPRNLSTCQVVLKQSLLQSRNICLQINWRTGSKGNALHTQRQASAVAASRTGPTMYSMWKSGTIWRTGTLKNDREIHIEKEK